MKTIDSKRMKAQAGRAAAFVRLFGSDQRLLILCSLLKAPQTVGTLAETMGLKQPNVSQHLAKLRAAGVVEPRRSGTSIEYHLVDNDVRPIVAQLYGRFCA